MIFISSSEDHEHPKSYKKESSHLRYFDTITINYANHQAWLLCKQFAGLESMITVTFAGKNVRMVAVAMFDCWRSNWSSHTALVLPFDFAWLKSTMLGIKFGCIDNNLLASYGCFLCDLLVSLVAVLLFGWSMFGSKYTCCPCFTFQFCYNNNQLC